MYAFKLKKYGESEVDIFTEWGVRLKTLPPRPQPQKKERPKRSWAECQGDDEYEPTSETYEPYEIDINFVYEGLIDTIVTNIIDFLEYLQGGQIGFYDEFTGREGMFRYVKMNDDAVYHQGGDALEFTITFKVDDPTANGGF